MRVFAPVHDGRISTIVQYISAIVQYIYFKLNRTAVNFEIELMLFSGSSIEMLLNSQCDKKIGSEKRNESFDM